jgi:TPR repeat protein
MARYHRTPNENPVTREPGTNPDRLLELGMMYSTGRSVPTDMVSAHKWFNIAAMLGNPDASRLRQEIADQMSKDEIALAQRAARDWVKVTLH